MSALGDYAEAVRGLLAEALGIAFVPGKLDGPVEHTDLGSVYVERVNEVGGRVIEADVRAVVRVFKQFQAPTDPENPYDPAPLYELVDQLNACVRAHQTGIAGVWFQRMTGVSIDPDKQGVEAQIVGRAQNAAV